MTNLDYRPLPPRKGTADIRPIEATARSRWHWLSGWTVLLATLMLTLAGTALLVWLGSRPPQQQAMNPQNMPLFAQTIIAEIKDPQVRDGLLSLDAQAAQGRSLVAQNPKDPQAWNMVGNANYDFIQTIYENAPNGQAYAQNLSRWLDASEAYSQSLALDPLQPIVRSDRALALIRYGLGFGNMFYVDQGLAEAERAIKDDDQTVIVVLNVGRAYALVTPPRMDEARRLWQRVIELAPNSTAAKQAQGFLDGAKP